MQRLSRIFKNRPKRLTKRVIISTLVIWIVIVTSGLLYLFGPWAEKSQAVWFDDNWAYRKTLTFTHNASVSTPTQVEFDIDTTGAPNTIQADCGDVRFTDINGNLLRYWLDSSSGACDTSSTDFDVLIPSIINGSNVIYIYYGNPQATNGTEAADFSEATTTPSGGAASAGSEEKAPSPIAYWRFDEGYGATAQDSTPSNYDGTLTNGPVWLSEDNCVSGKCLKFDGSNDYVSLGNTFDQNGSNPFTITTWFRTTASGATVYSFVTKADIDSPYTGYTFGLNQNTGSSGDAGKVGFNLAVSGADLIERQTTATFNDGKWHQAVVTYDGSKNRSGINIYVDGQLQSMANNGNSTMSGSSSNSINLEIGARDGTSQPYSGHLDEIKFYNYVRTAEQIKADFNAKNNPEGASATIGVPQRALSDGLAGYWKMDDGGERRSGMMLDSSINSNHIWMQGDVQMTAVGKYGSASSYDGSGDCSKNNYSNGDFLDFPGTNFTINTWVKISGYPGTNVYRGIVDKETGGTRNGYTTWLEGANSGAFTVGFERFISGTNQGVGWAGGSDFVLGSWQMLTFRFDGSTVKIYHNGIEKASASSTATMTDNSQSFTIGMRQACAASSSSFSGQIDEVRVYNRALGNNEIQALYNYNPSPVAYWSGDNPPTASVSTGDGADGSVTISSSKNINLDTIAGGRSYADGIAYRVTAPSDGASSVSRFSGSDTLSNGIAAGDEVLLINMQGTSGDSTDVGNYEFMQVQSVAASSVTFTSAITKSYDGTTASNQKVIIQRVPNYTDVTIDASVTLNAYDWEALATAPTGTAGYRTGIVAFRASGTVTNSGTINVDNLGYRGAAQESNPSGFSDGNPGEGFARALTTGAGLQATGDNGGGGGDSGQAFEGNGVGGGGGGHAYKGGNGKTFGGSSSGAPGEGGYPAGDGSLSRIFLGGGGGNGGEHDTSGTVGPGGDGGGIVLVFANTFTNSGSGAISSNGGDGTAPTGAGCCKGGSGGGAGGSVYVSANTLNLGAGTVTASGGTGASGNTWTIAVKGGNGSTGRVYLSPQVQDISGNSQGAGVTGSVTDNGRVGKAISFDGTNDVLLAAETDPTDLGATVDSYSVGAWIKTTTDGSGTASIIAKDNGSGAYPFNLYLNSSEQACFLISDGTNSPSVCGSTALNDGKWHHIAGVRDVMNDTIYIYVDGVRVNSATDSTTATMINNDNLTVGNSGSAYTANDFTGQIDDIKIYNYARSAGQVTQDMNGDHPAPGSPVGSALGYWKFDEGVDNTCSGGSNDACNSGNGSITLDGSQSGMSSPATSTSGWTQAGKFGKALLFDGTNDYVSVSDNAALDLTTTGSVSLWYYPLGTPSGSDGAGYYLLAKGRNFLNTPNGYLLSYQMNSSCTGGRALRLDIGNGSSYGAAQLCISSLTTSTWYHIAGTWDGTTIRLYLNGVPRGTNGTQVTPGNNSDPLVIGSGQSANNSTIDKFANGAIDEVKVYNGVLSAEQIKADMNQGSTQVLGALSDNSSYEKNAANQEYCIPGDSTSCAAPLLEFNLDEKTGSTAYDRSGNALNGTITGATWASGKLGAALSFDGSDDITDTSTTSSLNLTGSSYTISAWIKTTQTGITTPVMIRDTGGTDANILGGIILNVSSGKASFDTWNYATNRVTGAYTINDGKWHQITGTYNSSTGLAQLYVDGKPDIGVTQTGSSGNVSKRLRLGANISNGGGGSQFLNGQIDQVKVFNYARSAAQVAWDFDKGKPIGWWKFDECQGTTTYDASANGNGASNGNNGTITLGAGGQTSAGTCTGSAGTSWKDGATGKLNSSLEFDGVDDYVTLGNTPLPLNIITNGNFTTCAWIYPYTTGEGGLGTIIDNYVADGGGWSFLIRDTGDDTRALQFSADAPAPNDTLTETTDNIVDLNSWQHVCVVFNGTSRQSSIYKNGQSQTLESDIAGSAGSIASDTDQELRIGNKTDATTRTFDGLIDDVRIFKYALTGTQIKTVMNEGGATRFGPTTGQP